MQVICPCCGEELDTLIFKEFGIYQLPEMTKIPESIERMLGCPNCKEEISKENLRNQGVNL